ncbi:MAG: exodeoxyribonuclease III [Patescibacteria group bacterium]|nr:exodeoxyribonuclease III [Patescibacteria group bacterium]MDE1945721.1 exodeoxyribonuclease III [Patescibacteria group bacterium]
MKLVSWNVNGLRAVAKKGAFPAVFETDPDIVCLQETKAHPDQLSQEIRSIPGYFSFFDHSRVKKGYSGVAIFSKIKPEKVEYGIGIAKFDDEGRTLVAYFKDFVLLNVYFPNGGGGPVRLKYKLDFYNAFLKFIEKLRKSGKSVIFCGDVNTAHEAIDLARPKENEGNTGFLPVERAWLDKVVNYGYLDTFRLLHAEEKDAYSYWDMKTFARDRNVGWRIDYFFVSDDLKDRVKKAEILDNIFGSDHCPVLLELK